jgi:hypothetical protein
MRISGTVKAERFAAWLRILQNAEYPDALCLAGFHLAAADLN